MPGKVQKRELNNAENIFCMRNNNAKVRLVV